MKITMKTLYSSPEGALQPGQTADVAPALAKALVAGGYAMAGDEEYGPEDANKANAKPKRSSARPSTKRGRGAQSDEDTGDVEGQGDGDTGDGDADDQGDGGKGGDGEQGAGGGESGKD